MDDQTRHEAPPQVNHGRSLAATALTWVPVAALAWSARVWSDRLPDPLPSHWSDLSTPDGFTSYAATWQVWLAVGVVGAGLGLAGAVLSWAAPMYQRVTTGLGAALGFGALGIWLATAHAAWDRADAHGSPLGWGVALPIVGGVLAALVALGLVGPRPRTVHTLRTGPSSRLALAPGERAVWAHRTFVVWPLAIGAVLAAVAVVLAITTDALTAALLGAAAVLAAVLAWVQVTVDERGLRLGLGPWAWTVKKVPLAAIAGATAESVEALDWGGWGYRVMPDRSALVLRSGPAIVLDLADGRRFAVTVDDPQTPVALLQALLARAAA